VKLLFHTTNKGKEILKEKVVRGNPNVSLSLNVLPQWGNDVIGIPFESLSGLSRNINPDFVKYEAEYQHIGNLSLKNISFVYFKIKYSPYSAKG